MDKIEPLQEKLSEIDSKIIELLQERFETVGSIWRIKKQNAIPLRDTRKERELIESLKSKAKVNPLLVEVLYTQIFNENERLHGE